MVVGALADVARIVPADVRYARHWSVHFCLPVRRSCRRPNTRYLLAQPFLADTAAALENRGASVFSLFLLGEEARRWLKAAATPSGSTQPVSRRRPPP